MEEIEMCLKPGGLLILIDSTGELLGEDQITVLPIRSKVAPKGSQLQRLFYGMDHFFLLFLVRLTIVTSIRSATCEFCTRPERVYDACNHSGRSLGS